MQPASSDFTDSDELYGSFTTGGGDVVVYDRDNPYAWLQSSYAVEIGHSSERNSA